MNDFQYHNTTDIRFGRNHIDAELHDAVAQFGNKVLLTYGGQSIKRSGLYERVLKLLDGLEVVELGGIAPNPKIDSVREGQNWLKTTMCKLSCCRWWFRYRCQQGDCFCTLL